jgi:hypothetical protein
MVGPEKHEYECDRCAAAARMYPDEPLRIGQGCDCGGAWVDVTPTTPNHEATE